jgi:hypothetical protein
MRRIDAIAALWENWARWAEQSSRSALGYPKVSVFARLYRSGYRDSVAEAVIPIDDIRAAWLDTLLQSWKLRHARDYLVVHCTYLGDPAAPSRQRTPMTQLEIARHLAIDPTTVRACLARADHRVAVALEQRKAESLPTGQVPASLPG